MLQKKICTTVLVAFFASVSLHAMDMDRVNEIVRQMKAAQGVVTPVVAEPAVSVAVETTPVLEVAVKKMDKMAVVSIAAAKGTISEESLGLRKTNLYTEKSETVGEKATYGKAAAGTSKKFERAYENAPPMIPHDVEGMLPIKIGNNACTGCHMPEVAPSMGATPIPKSHFASFRPVTTIAKNGAVVKEGKAVKNTSDFKTVVHKLDKLSNARFNCSQCHAPQSTGAPLVENTFTPDFLSKDGKNSSNLIDTINEGVK